MECQNTIKNLKINKNKSIGQVIVVVEGESEEFKLLKYIFTNVLDYNYITIKRNQIMKSEFQSKSNPNSTIIVANTNNSNIRSIMEDNDYQDKLYSLLKKEYNGSLKNTRIYIIWDRDYESNNKDIVLKTLSSYQNSLDNEFDMNGLLLLNYPCIESYEISCFDKQFYKKTFRTSEETKKLCRFKRYYSHNIDDKSIIRAVVNMHRTLNSFDIHSYDSSNFYKINKKIFDYEQDSYDSEKIIYGLSLLSIMLVDLGIIEYDK